MLQKILMVCTGNICRSPMAEYYLKDKLKNNQSIMQVSSAGIHALESHSAAHEAQTALKKYNIDCSEHRGRQLTEEIIKESDLILAAEKLHKYNIIGTYPMACGKVHLMCRERNTDIPDPYQRSIKSFEDALELITQGLDEWNQKFNWF